MSAPHRKVHLKLMEILHVRKKSQNNQNNQLLGDGIFPFLENASRFFPVSHLKEGFWFLSCSWAACLTLHLKNSWKFLARAEEISLSWTVERGSVQLYRTIYKWDHTGYLRVNTSQSPVANAWASLLYYT